MDDPNLEAREYIAQGERVVALGHERQRIKATGRVAEVDWAMVFTVVMPVVLLLLFNAIFSGSTTFQGSDVSASNYFTPGIIAYSIMLSGYSGLLVSVVTA